MTQDLPPTTPVDGIAAPPPIKPVSAALPESPARSPESLPKAIKSRSGLNLPLMTFLILAVLYILPAIVLTALLPRQDGGYSQLKFAGNVLYGGGAFLWGCVGFIALLRIGMIKDRPRLKTVASVRMIIGIVPMLFVSGLTLLLINGQPRLSLEIIAPASSLDLIAPVSVTFGMNTALKVFAEQQLRPLKFEWDFTGDGVTDQETFDPESTFLVRRSGIYPITVAITMTNGTVKKAGIRLVVPRASFGLEPLVPVIDEPVTFSIDHLFPKQSDQKVPTLQKAKWDFDGDGTVDVETGKMTATTTYHKLGPVSVSVTMTLSNQTESTLQRRIDVVRATEQPFPVTLETEPKTLLGPAPFGIVFTLKTNEPVANAAWDFGDQKSGEGLRIAHVFADTGNFPVTVSVRSQSGFTAKLSKTVRVTTPLLIPDLTFQGTPAVRSFVIDGDVPLTVDITPVTSQPLISFSWDAQNASEVIATEKSFHAVYRDGGKYFLDLIGVDPDQNVFRKRITVNAKAPKSIVSFTMDPPTPTAPETVTFDASDTFVPSGEEITGFEWDYGDVAKRDDETKFSGSSTEHLFTKPGTFIVTLTIHTTSNQVYVGKQTLLVKAPTIDACFMPSRSSGKAPLGVRFDASCSTGNFTDWLWDFGDNAQSDQQSPTHVFPESGEYSVVLRATMGDGRKSTKTATISVQ